MLDLSEHGYEVLDVVGTGAQGETLRARRRESGDVVAVKKLDLGAVDDWKAVELFERHCETLASLEHAAIPEFVEGLNLEGDGDVPELALVREFVEGETLEARLAEGEPMTADALRDFLGSMLDVLAYLHDRTPPVVHRDVKPANIVRRPDGSYALIDFGTVQNIVQETAGGSTVVGTAGYTAPEQLMGRAEPASDLYALGATAAALAAGRPADALPGDRFELDYRGQSELPGELEDVLDSMLRRDPDDRVGDARTLRRRLDGEAPLEKNDRRDGSTKPAPEVSDWSGLSADADFDSGTGTLTFEKSRHFAESLPLWPNNRGVGWLVIGASMALGMASMRFMILPAIGLPLNALSMVGAAVELGGDDEWALSTRIEFRSADIEFVDEGPLGTTTRQFSRDELADVELHSDRLLFRFESEEVAVGTLTSRTGLREAKEVVSRLVDR